jgi:hypothetical protein
MIAKIRSFQNSEMLQAFVLFGGYHDHRGFPVFGHSLRLATRSLNDLAEPILGILDRPTALNHGPPLLAKISSYNMGLPLRLQAIQNGGSGTV